MKKIIFSAVPLLALLSGCSTNCPKCYQEQGMQEAPFTQLADTTLTTGGYVRDPSAEFYTQSRAGAAVRMKEASHVLWDCHYVADANAKIRNTDASSASKKAVAGNSSAKSGKKSGESSARKGVKRTDKSIYAKDKSVYAKDKSVYAKDKSVYAKDKSVYAKTDLASPTSDVYFDPASRSMVRKLKPAKEQNKNANATAVEGASKAPCDYRLSCKLED